MLSTVIIVLVVVIFIITFVVPLAKQKLVNEGFQMSTNAAIHEKMVQYMGERDRMITSGNRQYNRLGDSLDPLLPSFAVASTGIDLDRKLTDAQYLKIFNTATNRTNKDIVKALANPDMLPSRTSPTNFAITGNKTREQLPPANDLILQARKCEGRLNGRDSCSMLDKKEYENCGVCIDAGTQYDGSNAQSFIGGLLSLMVDRNEAKDIAAGGKPSYYPSLGKCPPGMFYVDSTSCKKAVNQLNCAEIGETGGFQGGKTHEGKKMPTVTCAQAPVAGTSTYLYQPPKKPYNAVLRFLTPFGSGITKVVVTHKPSGRTYLADNNDNPGQEFTVVIRNVIEADPIDIMVAQEQPHRSSGKAEVFMYKDARVGTYTLDTAKAMCERIGTTLATTAQVTAAGSKGLQAGETGNVIDATGNEVCYSIQSGTRTFAGLGSRPSAGITINRASGGAWCYGFKPPKTPVTDKISVAVTDFFESFGNRAQPAQGPSIYSQYTTPDSLQPPGTAERAILIQWEMEGSQNRTVGFQPTISKVNGYPATRTLRMLGPFIKSSVIAGPAWVSNFSMQKNQFWMWSNNSKSQSVIFSAQVPGYLEDPFYSDDKANAPLGPLITDPATMDLLKTSPCFAEGQESGNYSIACLLTLFQGAGGDPTKGTLATENGGLGQLNKMGDISDISAYLSGLYLTATTGKDSNGNVISMDMATRIAAMNSAAVQMFGFEITNPCEDLVDNADGSVGLMPKPMGQVTPACLQYLWLNNLSDKDRTDTDQPPESLYTNTYTSVADRFSGLRYNESTPKRRGESPFQPCTTKGSMAPIKGNEPDMQVVGTLSSMPNLQAVQNFFNGIHKQANYPKGPQDAAVQEKALGQCYGVKQTKSTVKGAGCGEITVSGPFTKNISGDSTFFTITGPATISVSSPAEIKYFAVGGGGGAGAKNGGGAGGLQTNTSFTKFASQKAPNITLNPNTKYSINIGTGGQIRDNGFDTTFEGGGILIRALGGAVGGATGIYCPASSGGCGGGGCPSEGTQGGSTNGPNGSIIANAAGGIGGNVVGYWIGGPGIVYNGVEYGAAAPNVAETYNGKQNTGEGGANNGVGGSGVFIIEIPNSALA